MEYTIQQTQGIKSKLFSVYQDGVEWLRSLSLIKAKKVVEVLKTSTQLITKLEETLNEYQKITSYQHLSGSDDSYGREQCASSLSQESGTVDQKQSESLQTHYERDAAGDFFGDGSSLCSANAENGKLHQKSSLTQFQGVVRQFKGVCEKQHQLVREQGQLVREQGQLVLTVAAIAEAAIDAGDYLRRQLDQRGDSSFRDFGSSREDLRRGLEPETVEVYPHV